MGCVLSQQLLRKPCHAGEPGAAKPKRKYTKRAEKWKFTKKAQAQAAATFPAAADAGAAVTGGPAEGDAAEQDMTDGELYMQRL